MADIPSNLTTALRDRYALERELGRGGMAAVYLARDLKHDRPVALKVIRAELGPVAGDERFHREIGFAARLQHPHILPLLDSGDAAGQLWFSMPYVEGQTLRDRLRQEHRLTIDEAIRIAREAGQALQYAHDHGVVHRDIKPENLLLTQDGNTLVADFGIARALEGDDERLTETGLAIGTPQYMSPEQATGGAVDARADQYALACVVYEMLAGEPPFTGPTPQAIIARSLGASRPSLRLARSAVPAALDSAVSRGLAREPEDRFPSVAAFAAALDRAALPTITPESTAFRVGLSSRRVALLSSAGLLAVMGLAAVILLRTRPTRAVVPDAEVIAILPFRTSGSGVDVMREGMVDLLARDLDAVGGVRTVDPRTVLSRWRRAGGPDADLSAGLTVGREVGAGSIVTGSVVEVGDRVRLDAELRTVVGQALAHARVDGPADSLLALVDGLALALLRDVWRSHQPLPNLRLGSLTSNSIEALRSYLDGERLYRLSRWDSAEAAFTRAVQADSGFALAYMRLASVFGWREGRGSDKLREYGAAAFRHADRLSERDRSLLQVYTRFVQGDAAGIDSVRDYLRRYPDDVEARYLLGDALFHANALLATPPESVQAAFDAVLRLDSSLTPALIHPAELALTHRDSTTYVRYLATMERSTGTADPAGRAALRVLWGPHDAVRDSLIRAIVAQGTGSTIGPGWALFTAAYRDPHAGSDGVLEMPTTRERMGPPEDRGRLLAMEVHSQAAAGLGRVHEARRLADSLFARDFRLGAIALTMPILLGVTPRAPIPELESRTRAMGPDRPIASVALAQLHLARGEAAAARAILARARSWDTVKGSPVLGALLDATEGWADLLEGDTTTGLRRIEAGLSQPGALSVDAPTLPLRLQWALALAARPGTRAEGIRRLRYGFELDAVVLPLTFYALGQAYEADGDHAEAAHFYASFLRLWDRADPDLQSWVERAREAVKAATNESGN